MRRKAVVVVALTLIALAGWLSIQDRNAPSASPPPERPAPAPKSEPAPVPDEEPPPLAAEATPPARRKARDGRLILSASHGELPAILTLTIGGRTVSGISGPKDESGRHTILIRQAVPGLQVGISTSNFRPATVVLQEPDLTAEAVLEALSSLTVFGGQIGLAEVVIRFGDEDRSLRLPGRVAFPKLVAGEYDLTISAPPRLVLAKQSVRLSPGDRTRLDLGTLDLGVLVSGKTVDESGQPVPRALVIAPTEGLPTGYEMAEARVTSDGQGSFEMQLVPGLSYRFRAEKDGFGCVEQPEIQVTSEGAPLIELVLSDAVALRGRVVDPDGKPIATAEVGVQRIYEPSGSHIDRIRKTETDADGRFALTDLPTGMKFRLVVRKPGWGRDDDRVFVAKPGGEEAIIVLHPERVIDIHVVDLVTGEPILNADAKGGQSYSTFTMTRIGPGQWRASGFTGTIRAQFAVGAEGYFSEHPFVEADETGPVVVRLTRMGDVEVHGVVVDEQGRPVERAQVRALCMESEKGRVLHARDFADQAGRFCLRHLRRGRTYRVHSNQFPFSGTALCSETQQFRAEPGVELRIVVRTTGRISGRLALPEDSNRRWPAGLSMIRTDIDELPTHGGNLANAPDRFHSNVVPPGTYRVSVGSFPYPSVTIENVVVHAGTKTDLGTIQIPRGVGLELRLSDSAGGSRSDYQVTLIGQDRKAHRILGMKRDGKVEYSRPPPGIWRIVACSRKDGANYDLGEIELKEGRDETVERVLPAPGSIRILVTDGSGRPVESIPVAILAEAPAPLDRILVTGIGPEIGWIMTAGPPGQLHAEREFRTDARGVVETGPLSPGRYQVSAGGARQTVLVSAGQAIAVTLATE